MTLLRNALVFTEKNRFESCDVLIDRELILNLSPPERDTGEIIDLTGLRVVPGFVDNHFHGALGLHCDDGTPESLRKISGFLASQGTTAFLPTIRPSSVQNTLSAIDAILKVQREPPRGASIVGIHLEGPFVSPQKKGALAQEHLRAPDLALLRQYREAAQGELRMITLAPELPGCLELIRYAAAHSITVSLGHSDATYNEALAAIQAGATQVTHLFNALRPFDHREPGVLGAALTQDSLHCELICDFAHVHPAAIRLALNAKGPSRIRMISDAVLAGVQEGTRIDDFYVDNGVARLPDGTIAGACQTLRDGIQNLLSLSVPLEHAVLMASSNPAAVIDPKRGVIAPQKRADLVALDDRLQVRYTWVGGKCIYQNPNQAGISAWV